MATLYASLNIALKRGRAGLTSAMETKCLMALDRLRMSSCRKTVSTTQLVVYVHIQHLSGKETRHARTALFSDIIAAIFGASAPSCFGQALARHSPDVMRAQSRLSMIVNCRANSSGSTSRNFSLRVRGMIGCGAELEADAVRRRGGPCDRFTKWSQACTQTHVDPAYSSLNNAENLIASRRVSQPILRKVHDQTKQRLDVVVPQMAFEPHFDDVEGSVKISVQRTISNQMTHLIRTSLCLRSDQSTS